MNPYLFVVGVPRSGTTLLQRMLHCHPDLAIANDTHFIPRVLEKTDRSLLIAATHGEAIPLTESMIANARNYHRIGRLGISDGEVHSMALSSSCYQSFVQSLYDRLAKSHSKRYAGEKTPDYVRRIPLLHGMFPYSRFVHIVRDGRDVALSLLQWANRLKGPGRFDLWEENPLAVCALWWRWLVLSGHRDLSTGANVNGLVLRYEDLVRDPICAMQKLAEFLEIDYREEMIEFYVGKEKNSQGLSAKSAWKPVTQGLRDWRTQMSQQDRELFEEIAGDALQLFGYSLSCATTGDRVQSQVKAYRAWWREHFPHELSPSRS